MLDFKDELSSNQQFIVDSALKEKFLIMIVIYSKENEIIGFSLVHKVSFNPFLNHTKPSVLDFIFIREKFRRNGYALKLLDCATKSHLQLTAFPSNEASNKLFLKAGYKVKGILNGCLVMQN